MICYVEKSLGVGRAGVSLPKHRHQVGGYCISPGERGRLLVLSTSRGRGK